MVTFLLFPTVVVQMSYHIVNTVYCSKHLVVDVDQKLVFACGCGWFVGIVIAAHIVSG